jgi:hypothetical protein
MDGHYGVLDLRQAMPLDEVRSWAAALFERALPAVKGFTSPRAWAFATIGLRALGWPETK